MLGNIDFARQYYGETFGYAAGIRQSVTLTVLPQRAEVSDPLNLRRVQDRKHLVPSRFSYRMCQRSHEPISRQAKSRLIMKHQPLLRGLVRLSSM
jgi:hypothetical protein